jgi:hypothetical protein
VIAVLIRPTFHLRVRIIFKDMVAKVDPTKIAMVVFPSGIVG